MSRRRVVIIAIAVASLSPWSTRAAWAQDPASDTAPAFQPLSATLFTSALGRVPSAPPAAAEMKPVAMPLPRFAEAARPHAMLSLYASTAVLQALDVHSTLLAFRHGAVEGNPIMAGITSHKAVFIATKAAVGMMTIFAAREMARHHKIGAIVTLIALNSAYALVVSHNYRLAHELR